MQPEKVRVVPGLQFSTSLARYIDGSAENRVNYIDGDA